MLSRPGKINLVLLAFLGGEGVVGDDDDDDDDVVGDDDDDGQSLAVVIIIWMLSRGCHLIRFAVLTLGKKKILNYTCASPGPS